MSPSNSSPFESRPTPKDEGSRNPSGGSDDKGGQSSRPAASPFEAPQQPKPQAKPAAADQQRQAPAARPAPAVSKSPVPGTSTGNAGAGQAGSANAARPAQARPAQAPAGQARPAQAPAGQGTAAASTAGLVKPAPKAKVRRAKLMISKVDPWSVLKMSFLLSVALGIVTVVAALVLWTVLDLTGIFNQVNKLVGDVAGSESGGFDLRKVASLGQVVSFSTIIAVVNVVLLTAISTLSAVLYNLAATLVGGVGVTLTDD
ncbi:DUF3566 domain-containing protein [Arthrobacter sp. RAF14]|uniref:DUF3566 domain-containing protein n=1 Tax=Arthrobacter sp. RAF14 TaxID=3233051 RepID=UPI003F9262D2